MVYKKVTFVSLVLSFLIGGMFGAHSRLVFHSPTQERSIDALACGLERLNSARGVRFDATTKECTSLSDTWFSNETFAQNSVYYLLTMYEELFNTTLDTGLRRIPGAFNTGYTVVTTFDTKDIKFNSIFTRMDSQFTTSHRGTPNKLSTFALTASQWCVNEYSTPSLFNLQKYSEQAVYFRFDNKSMVCQRIQYIFPV